MCLLQIECISNQNITSESQLYQNKLKGISLLTYQMSTSGLHSLNLFCVKPSYVTMFLQLPFETFCVTKDVKGKLNGNLFATLLNTFNTSLFGNLFIIYFFLCYLWNNLWKRITSSYVYSNSLVRIPIRITV